MDSRIIQECMNLDNWNESLEIVVEECSELIKAIQKVKRYDMECCSDVLVKAHDNLREEIVDVLLVVETLARRMAMSEDLVNGMAAGKIGREVRRRKIQS